MKNIKQVIIVRRDLEMPPGKVGAQVSHASMKVILDNWKTRTVQSDYDSESGEFTEHKRYCEFVYKVDSPWDHWLNGSFTKVVLGVDSLEELNELYDQAKNYNLPRSYIVDEGRTVFNKVPTCTCIAIGPEEAEEIDKITGHLKLL